MVDAVTLILLAGSLILFFGFFSEFLFRKLNVPDVLFLILLGFLMGPNVLGYISSADIATIAPVFTTFTLLFLLFDGAFNIKLSSLIKEFSHSFALTLFNFVISSAVVTVVMVIGGFPVLVSLLTGFLLGGVSSSFVVPLLQQIKIPEKIYSLLTLESALTDVFCIVFSLSVIEIIKIGEFGFRATLAQITSSFAVAGLIGILAGVVWIILVHKVFKEHNYMMTIAYLILVYVIAEVLQGNGAIAALFFGIILKNSRQLTGLLYKATRKSKKSAFSVTTPSEQFFYHQISFFLKTFFFVYIGILIDLSDWKALLVGGFLSILIMISRMASLLLTRKLGHNYKELVNSIFARGLAAAAVAQVAITAAVPHADFIAKVAYVVITGTIILSSVRVFLFKRAVKA